MQQRVGLLRQPSAESIQGRRPHGTFHFGQNITWDPAKSCLHALQNGPDIKGVQPVRLQPLRTGCQHQGS